ncbi:hypothetical protein KBB49_00935 [Candidatus Saccharibacteria bacterium]|jgi:hypothetical protein|nr:hypothetical protein [Candidatus Saccharibacteria bacterium]
MSNDSFITPEILQAGAEISTRGSVLADMASVVSNETVEVTMTGEVSMMGAMHALNVGANAKKERVEAIKVNQLETLGQATELLGSVLHEDWREQSFSNGEGGFNPRVKCLVEREGKQKWVNADALTEEESPLISQDIANTSFSELDPYWQKDNREAAQAVVEIIVNRNGKIDLNDPETYEQIGHEIHEAWLSRAGWIEPGLEKPFSELPEEQQEKDINQMRLALKVFGLDKDSTENDQAVDDLDRDAEQLIEEETFKERLGSFMSELEKRGIAFDWLTADLDLLSLDDLATQTEDEALALQARVISDAMAWIDQVLTDKEFVPDSNDDIYNDYRDEAMQKIGYMLEYQPEEASLAILNAIESVIGTDFAKLPIENEERLHLLSMSGDVRDSELDTEQMLQEIRVGLLLDLQSQLSDAGSNIAGEDLSKTIWRLLQSASANELETLLHADFVQRIDNKYLQISEQDFNAVKDAVVKAYNSGLDSAE